MKMAGATIIYNTDKCKQNILKWAILCALNEECIAPPGARKSCPPTNSFAYFNDRYNETNDVIEYDEKRLLIPARARGHQSFNMCHRFDQAITSILVENFNRYNESISWLHDDEQLGKPFRNGVHELVKKSDGKIGFYKSEQDRMEAEERDAAWQERQKSRNNFTPEEKAEHERKKKEREEYQKSRGKYVDIDNFEEKKSFKSIKEFAAYKRQRELVEKKLSRKQARQEKV